jgi:hypothetical protein
MNRLAESAGQGTVHVVDPTPPVPEALFDPADVAELRNAFDRVDAQLRQRSATAARLLLQVAALDRQPVQLVRRSATSTVVRTASGTLVAVDHGPEAGAVLDRLATQDVVVGDCVVDPQRAPAGRLILITFHQRPGGVTGVANPVSFADLALLDAP